MKGRRAMVQELTEHEEEQDAVLRVLARQRRLLKAGRSSAIEELVAAEVGDLPPGISFEIYICEDSSQVLVIDEGPPRRQAKIAGSGGDEEDWGDPGRLWLLTQGVEKGIEILDEPIPAPTWADKGKDALDFVIEWLSAAHGEACPFGAGIHWSSCHITRWLDVDDLCPEHSECADCPCYPTGQCWRLWAEDLVARQGVLASETSNPEWHKRFRPKLEEGE